MAGGSKIDDFSMEKRLQDKISSSDPKYREKAPNIGPRWGPKSLLDGLKSMLKTGSKTSVKKVMQVDAGRREPTRARIRSSLQSPQGTTLREDLQGIRTLHYGHKAQWRTSFGEKINDPQSLVKDQ